MDGLIGRGGGGAFGSRCAVCICQEVRGAAWLLLAMLLRAAGSWKSRHLSTDCAHVTATNVPEYIYEIYIRIQSLKLFAFRKHVF